MRVYIAAPWACRPEAIEVGKQFEAAGHIVTSRWFAHPGDPKDYAGTLMSTESARLQAAEDVFDVLSAEALIVLNLQKSEGKAVETGVALMARLPIISVGSRSNIFQTLGYEVETVEGALEVLNSLCS